MCLYMSIMSVISNLFVIYMHIHSAVYNSFVRYILCSLSVQIPLCMCVLPCWKVHVSVHEYHECDF